MSDSPTSPGVRPDTSRTAPETSLKSPSKMGSTRSLVSPIMVILTAGLVAFQILGLSPKNLELGSDPESDQAIDPQDLTLASEQLHPLVRQRLPIHKVPEYTIDQFQFTALLNSQKVWRIMADRSSTYHKENITHASAVTLYIFPEQTSQSTSHSHASVITAKEAIYGTNQDSNTQSIELFGDVEVTTPDGYILRSPYFIYRPELRKIQAPVDYEVQGLGKGARQKGDLGELDFTSSGMDVHLNSGLIHLLQNPKVTLRKTQDKGKSSQIPGETMIESQRARIDTKKKITFFDLHSKRRTSADFVRITQPQLYSRARTATLKLSGNESGLDYLTLDEDVLIKQRRDPKMIATNAPLRYATGGTADFHAESNLITLREYPQIYEDQNTMTGETIQISSDFDSVEIEHGNAFANEKFGAPQR